MNMPARGSLLGIEHLDVKDIVGLLKLARRMNPQKARPLLRGKRVVAKLTATRRSAAAHQIVQRFFLAGQEPVPRPIGRAVAAENVRHLEHDRSRLRAR